MHEPSPEMACKCREGSKATAFRSWIRDGFTAYNGPLEKDDLHALFPAISPHIPSPQPCAHHRHPDRMVANLGLVGPG